MLKPPPSYTISFQLTRICHQQVKISSSILNLNVSRRYLSSSRDSTTDFDFTSNIQLVPRWKNIKSKLAQTATTALSCTSEVSQNSPIYQNLPFKATPKVNSTNLKSALKGKDWLSTYFQLTKPHLTFLVMLSSICSYALSPYTADLTQLIALTVGTTLCSGSANAINMGREPSFDRQMTRTAMRPVARGALSSKQAFKFAAGCGTMGGAILLAGVNPVVSLLGVSNIALYGWLYTSLKRTSILNTWVGGLVGAIPPLMGWAAAANMPALSLLDPGCWCLAGLLYAWQFPHFNTLSHGIREQYRKAGYIMTAWKKPLLNARVAARYSLLMFPLCFGLTWYGVTDQWFPWDSGLVNGWLAFWSCRFYWQQRKVILGKYKGKNLEEAIIKVNKYAKKGFWCSIVQLPLVLILAIIHKKGRWDGVFE
ncbi:hypothetical protein TBLA_0D01220 [Henningerozyma blattae CBS 6284]|uniref:Protoheme IX farnesyltransferase, mitochondrial n=1 Tax=Henningerozyma blattae (strain ATCC 34711 / CBS 6284 / DSM 70876 / NBRC 10599 / NRRL Y-10934 / UCD 77-7) TaxID=1071380 RepID=I2H2M8_HENB6|nr:hypothetical protein TBLA_0D01220 [Tetrapisispora blattae CBS 6284]CCH60630.1 hypothetical protein TBLA_0D01220 [Tetrapisispora blattae CBS 6284]